MNKQAITFFSLFSLILVLSVYYVMIPPVDETVTTQDNTEQTLQDKLDEKRNQQTQEQNDILASSTSSGEDLNQALETLSENKTASNVETTITNKLKELGYENAFCEISGEIIKVTITKKDSTKEDALVVMEAVLNACEQKYSPEIKFIDEWLAILSKII